MLTDMVTHKLQGTLGIVPKSLRNKRQIKHVLEAQAKRGKRGKLIQHSGGWEGTPHNTSEVCLL